MRSSITIGWGFLIVGIIFIFLENLMRDIYSAFLFYTIAFVSILIGIVLVVIGRMKENKK